MRIIKLVFAAITLTLLLSGCSDKKPTEPTDKWAPLITWNSPTGDQEIVTDTVTVRFTAADDGGVVTNVKVYIDGLLAATLTAEPYQTSLDFTALGNNRAARVYATASDPTGKVGATADTLKFTKALPPDTAVWTELTGFASQPLRRYGHSMTVNTNRTKAVVFGGYNVLDITAPLNDTWAFDFASNTWGSLATTGTHPTPRYEHAAGIAGDLLVIFGGKSATDTLFEDYAWLDLNTLVWTQSFAGNRPQPSHGIATASLGDYIYLYGGSYDTGPGNPDENSSALWRFSLLDTAFTLISPTNMPGRRFRSAMTRDLEGDRIFLYGGRSAQASTTPPSDTADYQFDVGTQNWESKPRNRGTPRPVEWAVAVYDSLNNRILMWGGVDGTGTLTTKLWQFSLGGGFWQEVPTKASGTPPSGRTEFGMVKDPHDSRCIMFGGRVGNFSSGETWELRW